jgi:hypothetical protein
MSSDLEQLEKGGITESDLKKVLAWLDPNREVSERKYNEIRSMVLETFTSNGCPQAEQLTHESIRRVVKALPPPVSFPDAIQLFRRAAKQVLREYLTLWASTKEAFERLLKWLDQNREKSAEKYGRIHSTLCRVFMFHGFADAESLADETINRVIKKIPKIEKTYKGDPALYFSRVASFICKEHARANELARRTLTEHSRHEDSLESNYHERTEEDDDSVVRKCFRDCLQNLKPGDRELILAYYDSEQGGKITDRKKLANKLKITMTNLRVRRFRIQTALEECINQCLKKMDDN